MITIYSPNETDFSTLGLGALAPYECVVEEQAGGMYELTMTHPMDAEGKWLNIGVGCIVKAPAPVRETPLVESEIVGEGEATEPVTVTRKIYKVQTNTGANLHLRQGPSTSTKILSKYRPGTEVVVLSQASGWGQVIVCSSGATGYMSMQYLVYVRDETETIEGDAPGPERVVYPVQSRMQLFRIFKVERDAAEREVRVEARHIFYDLLGNVVKNEYAPEGEAADAVVEELFERALNPHDFSVHCQTARSVTGEYTRRGLVECLLDPDDGVLPQTGARLVRDNFDVWLLPDATRETGVTIRHGKNLLGATLTTDWDSLVTRIIPVGQDKEGKALLLEGTTYMDSPHIGDYPVICAQAVEYDVKIGQEGIDNAAQARAKLQELAEADFSDNGVDLPTVGLDVDFVALGETEEYRAYADLEAVHLYDTVRVIAKSAGIDAAVRVTGYKWDALGRKYEAVTLGEIADLKTTVYGYELQRGSVKTIKIAPGAVGSAQLRDLAVQYAHINTAAVEQLSANSITALKAYIAEIVAGSVTTDELYAGIASIALAQLTTANIENANIDWAQIGTLSADIAAIAKAHLTDADIDWAQIANLTAAVAEIAEAKIAGATIGTAQIDDLEAVVAEIIHAQVATGEFDFAEVENFLGSVFILGQGIAGTVSIENLMVTRANMLNATVQTLILPGTDGKYYQITVGTDGQLSTEEVTVTDSEIAAGETEDGRQIVATTINADTINGSTITAQQAVLNTVLTQALTAGKITAGEALIASASIPTLYVTSVEALGNSMTFSANEQIQMIVGNVQQAQETADSAQEAAEQAAPYISATPPGEAPEAGKLWLDEGVEPSVLRKWRGADVTTEREYTETRVGCGKNLYDVNDRKTFSDGVTVDADGWITVTVDNSAGSSTIFKNCFTNPSLALRPSTQYAVVCEIAQLDISGQGIFSIVDLYDDLSALSQFANSFSLALDADTQTGTRIQVVTSRADLSGSGSMLRTYIEFTSGASGTVKFRLSVLEDTSITAETFEYEPYHDIPSLAIDNGAGQIESVAVKAGCRAKQEMRANLFDPSAITSIPGSGSGVTLSHAADGGIQIAGTTGDGYAVASNDVPAAQYVKLPEGALTASIDAPAGVHMLFRLLKDGTIVEGGDLATNSQRTQDIAGLDYDSVSIGVQVAPNTTVNATVHPMLNAGTQALPFEAYKTVLPITGRESVEIAACGKNLLTNTNQGMVGWTYGNGNNAEFTMSAESMQGVSGMKFTLNEAATGWSVLCYGEKISGSEMQLDALKPGTQYTVSFDAYSTVPNPIKYITIMTRTGIGSITNVAFINALPINTWTHVTATLTTVETLPEIGYQALYISASSSPFTLSVCNLQLEEGSTATAYEPYRSMGGGTVTPTEPLYGLPGAEDTVEVSTDGDVLVTRRTAVLELDGTENWVRSPKNNHGYYWRLSVANIFQITTPVLPNIICSHYQTENPDAQWAGTDSCISQNNNANLRTEVLIYDTNYAESDLSAWKAYLAAQYAAGTPVTIVYELAAPETEALTAISPIAPQPGRLNLYTDADALTATIHGSGWETVNDTSSIQDALANLDGDLASLINEVGLLNGEVGSIAQQIISPDGIKNIVFESTEYQAMANTVEQNANELSVTQTTVTDINGRVETIEGTVRISGSNIDIGRSDSNVQLHLDNEGWSISEVGQETIYARQNRVVAPRFQTTSLIFGALAFNSSGGHFRLMKYGG